MNRFLPNLCIVALPSRNLASQQTVLTVARTVCSSTVEIVHLVYLGDLGDCALTDTQRDAQFT